MIFPRSYRWPGVAVMAALAAPVLASSLEVSPTSLDIVADGPAAGALLLRNRAAAASNVQVRLYRWTQADGVDVLEPTADVAASPPFATLAPGADYTVRVVRLSKRPIVGEEAYRLLVDELPAPRQADGTINLAIRHSLPIFFRTPIARGPEVEWRAAIRDGKLMVSARNAGDRRLRVAALRVTDRRGIVVDFGRGLAGYVLGHTRRDWATDAPPGFDPTGARIDYSDAMGQQHVPVYVADASPTKPR